MQLKYVPRVINIAIVKISSVIVIARHCTFIVRNCLLLSTDTDIVR